MENLTPQQEDYLLEEAREKDWNCRCLMCKKKLDDYDTENSCKECE